MEVDEAIARWVRSLEATVTTATTAEEIATRLLPVARDDAWVIYGSSGRRSRLFLIDDQVQVRFDFDHKDQLVAYSVQRKTNWLKGPDGVLLEGFHVPDEELLFPAAGMSDEL